MRTVSERICLALALCLALCLAAILCAQCTSAPQPIDDPSRQSELSAESGSLPESVSPSESSEEASDEPEISEESAVWAESSYVIATSEPEEPQQPTHPVLERFGDVLPADVDADFLQFVEGRFGEKTLEELAAQEQYTDDLWRELTGNTLHVLRSLYADEPGRAENVRLISLGERGQNKTTVMTFGGDICFADNYVVMQYLKTTENGWTDCIDPEWAKVMRNADLAMLNNEFTISDRGTRMAGKMYTFRAAPAHTAIYRELGVDFVTLANNHAYDFGEDAFLDTLETLQAYGIDYAGGGKNAAEAQRPFYYLVDGRKIAFVSATRAEKNILTPEAGAHSSGVFRCYDPTRLLEVISEAKANSDYVVLFVHWGTEHSDVLEKVQKTTSHAYIDAGADLIVGSHAHQLQGIEFYKGKAIFYNLGNFWFDDDDVETGLVRFALAADGRETFYFLPGMQTGCVTSYELGTERGREILDHLAAYLPGIRIGDDGRVMAE